MTNLQKIRRFLQTLDPIQTEKPTLNDPQGDYPYISEEWQVDGVTIWLTSKPNQEGERPMEKHFEVKTGKNKGFYIVTKRKHLMRDLSDYETLAEIYGIMPYEYNSGFYRYHRINPFTEIVWTHARFAGHEFNRRVYAKLLQRLGCQDWQYHVRL